MPSRLARSSSDRTRPVASSSNHARPRTTALISAGSHLEGWFCGASPGNTILVATPRRLKSTAAVNSIVLAPGASDTREGKSPLNSAPCRTLMTICLSSTMTCSITRLQRYYEPLRHPSAPGLSLTSVRLIIPDHAVGLPVLRTLSLCTCCRQYPGAAAGRNPRSSHPAVAAFPDSAVGSAYTSTFSRLAQRSLALRPAHSRGHQVVTAIRRLQQIGRASC